MKITHAALSLLLTIASSAGAVTFTREQLRTPVGLIYHYGERKVLMDDAALDTIPKPAWDKYVMGDSASWSQQPFRRGLYGCANGGQTEFYADSAARPWVMGIHIKPECLRSETVVHIPELYQRADFKNWFASLGNKSGFASWNDLLKKCFVYGDGRDFVGFNFDNDSGLYTVCGKITDRFLNDKQVSVVYDDRIEGCWYIRRRECIEKIDGSPDEVVDMLARVPARIQESYPGEHGPQEVTLDLSRNSRVMFHIFASSMAEATAADPAHVEQIARSAQGTVGLETE
ncbi:MAG: hypothetical protein JST16_04150, partial [Bdellovibrionales bacterium]|nr:hypothetical protein [Bdellovibrionales bacterium]